MATYNTNKFSKSNVNYLNKDFSSLKSSLMNYTKSYFPNSYRDFNETSPGMMLLEMNAYVGDVLSFYVDQQYREMLLPLAEERRNVINLANMFGYKVKPIVPAFVDLTFSQDLNANPNDRSTVDYSTGGVFKPGIQVFGTDSSLIFETLDFVDFQISGSHSVDTSEIASFTEVGLADTYTLKRTVRAVSAKTKTISFNIGAPQKFKKITITDTNVIDIISCVDSNGNNWYEVDYLAQDKVPVLTHYTNDSSRTDAYNSSDNESEATAVPYSLQYVEAGKRFTRETNEDNTTSLVFGNGILQNGSDLNNEFIDLEQVGIVIPGQQNDIDSSIDPLLGDEYSTLGETPNNTTLTITYRVGGGINANVPSGDISTILSGEVAPGSSAAVDVSDLSVVNNSPAIGGRDEETIDEIREKTKAYFTTQNRCVTKEDFEARIMNLPSKIGNIAKVYVTRNVGTIDELFYQPSQQFGIAIDNLNTNINQFAASYLEFLNFAKTAFETNTADDVYNRILELQEAEGAFDTGISYVSDLGASVAAQYGDLSTSLVDATYNSSVRIYLLGYNSAKNLVGNPNANNANIQSNDKIPKIMIDNISTYLDQFRILTDSLIFTDGYIVNFGVFFDVIVDKYANKEQVNILCNYVIKEYFRIDKMQFNQPIFLSDLEYELMGVEGVRSIGHVTITQNQDYNATNGSGDALVNRTYRYSINPSTGEVQIDSQGTQNYGYFYDFEAALNEDKSIIKPPKISTPTVFELKNPNVNIVGRVR